MSHEIVTKVMSYFDRPTTIGANVQLEMHADYGKQITISKAEYYDLLAAQAKLETTLKELDEMNWQLESLNRWTEK